MKRVLVLAYFFPPLGGGGCQRTVKLVRYLEAQGWVASVITTADRDYWILDRTLLEEVPRSTEILRVRGGTALGLLRAVGRAGIRVQEPQGARQPAAFRAFRSLQRWMLIPDGYRGWAGAARRLAEARLRAGGVDALWTTSSPESAHLAGLALKRRFGIPWIADFRDPWVGRVTYRPPTRIHDRAHRSMERAVVLAADRVTVVSKAMESHYRARYPDVSPERFFVLENGYDPDDWRRVRTATEDSARETERDRGRFVLLHAGQLAHRPTVRTLLAAVRRVVDEDRAASGDLVVRFLGGNEELDARERARYALGQVLDLAPSRPHLAALAAMARAGGLVLLGHGGAADSLLYTGKIYEYLSSGRPVLGIVDPGPCAELIGATRCGLVVGARDVDGAALVIRGWLHAWRAGKDLSTGAAPEILRGCVRPGMAAQAAGLLSQISAAAAP